MTDKNDNGLMSAVESVFIEVMKSKKSTFSEKIDAAKEATKLMLIKHKITDTSDEAGSFFNKK